VRKIKENIETNDFEEIEEVKKYFKRNYSIFSEKVLVKLINLDLPKKKKKSIIKELAFLPERKQIKYIEELCRISNFKIRDS
jgi:hypothetical protein